MGNNVNKTLSFIQNWKLEYETFLHFLHSKEILKIIKLISLILGNVQVFLLFKKNIYVYLCVLKLSRFFAII